MMPAGQNRDIAIKSLNVISGARYHTAQPQAPPRSRPTTRENTFKRMQETAAAIARDLQLIPKPKADQRENFTMAFDALFRYVEDWCKHDDEVHAQVFRGAYQDARNAWDRLVIELRRAA